jgi:hypothetical protein
VLTVEERSFLAEMAEKHLPGRHDQRTHGRRKPKPDLIPKLSTLAERIAIGERSRQPLSGGQWANVDLVELNDGSKVVRKAQLKPIEGRPAREVQDAEELGPKVLRAFGLRSAETHRASARVVWQEYMEGTPAETLPRRPGSFGVEGPYYDTDQGRLLGLADALMYNYDRRSANWLVAEDGVSPIGIDHGMGFAWTHHKPGTPHTHDRRGDEFWAYLTHFEQGKGFVWSDNDLSPQDITSARKRLEQLRPDFDRVGRGEWLDNMLITLDAIAPHAKGTRARLK